MEMLVEIFQALGNDVRLKIFKSLLEEKRNDPKGKGMCVCEILKICDVANSTMTHHLDWLKSAGLLISQKEGQWIYYDINMKKVEELKRYIEKNF